MRTDFPSATRAEYIGGDVTPVVRTTLRRLRLDFGEELIQKNDAGVIDGVELAGDDYYDPIGHRVIWGDSCISDVSPYCKLLLVSESSWATGGSNWWYARSTSSSDDWSISTLSPSGTGPGTMSDYTRIGVYPGGGVNDSIEAFYVWYFDSSDDLYRITLTHTISGDSWAWSGKTTGYDISGFTGAAIHPISTEEAILVRYDDPSLEVQYVKWNGVDWTASDSEWVVFMSDELIWSDAHWSDAEFLNSNEVVVSVNLNRWGSTYTTIYNKTSGIWSVPVEMLPSSERWGNLRVLCSGLSVIDSKLWAVTIREPVANLVAPMARHVALASSTDGKNWTDEGFITKSELRGKLLYQDTEGYCYVAGNVSVARAESTNLLGYDNASMKYEAPEISAMSVTESGPSSATECQLVATYSAELLAAVEDADEITVELGTSSESYGTYKTLTPVSWWRNEAPDEDVLQIVGLGKLSKLVGQMSYQPMAARVYDGPISEYSNFSFENGEPRITLRQETGTWVTQRHHDTGGYVLHCKKDGMALFPRMIRSQYLELRTSFQYTNPPGGIFMVFWYEDNDNYWVAGVRNYSGTHKVCIWRLYGGNWTEKSSTALTSNLSGGNWYSLYVDTKPGQVRAYVRRSDSFDFTTSTDSTSYDVTSESIGPPESHHCGLQVMMVYQTTQLLAYFKEFFVHEGIEPWTVDDVANNILAMCGVSRDDVFTSTGVGTLGPSSQAMGDIDITITDGNNSEGFVLWASSTSTSGTNVWSGLYLTVYTNKTSLRSYENDGAGANPYTELAVHPNLITFPGSPTSKTIRVKATKTYISVTCDGHFLTAFPVSKRLPEGYIACTHDGSVTEFTEVLDSFIWDAGELASSALSRLLQGRRAKLIERSDGSVAISRFDAPLGDVGTYTTPVVIQSSGRDRAQLASLIEMVGAEDNAFFLNAESARRSLRYQREDNPTVMTEAAAVAEAARSSRLSWERYRPGGATLYVVDPAVELEDRAIVISGDDVRVDSMSMSFQKDASGRLSARAQVNARTESDPPTSGVYDTATYDGTVEYD